MRELEVTSLQAGQRLDKLLGKYLKEASGSFLHKMLRKKNITLNGRKADGTEKLVQGDTIRLFFADETLRKFTGQTDEARYPQTNLDIVYEDDHILLVNKPAGMLSQKAEPSDVSLNEYAIGYLLHTGAVTPESLAVVKPSVCNRLDRNTSGIVLCGVSLKGSQEGSQLLRSREIGKFYHAIVWGRTPDTVDERAWFRKDTGKNRAEFFRGPGEGRSEVHTAFRTLRRSGGYSLLEVDLLTGKTHQIRAHLAYLGWPVLGDPKYGPRKKNDAVSAKRQMLHAIRLEFPEDHVPSGLADGSVTAPYPEDFRKALRETGLD